ncbi:MAG: PDZ domain-containing protein [Alphaproteobacteria bacterium]
MTIKLLGLGLAAVCVTACAPTTWVKQGATQQDYYTDTYSCEKDMRQSMYFGGGIIGAINADNFQKECMVAKGWRQQGQAAPAVASTAPTATAAPSATKLVLGVYGDIVTPQLASNLGLGERRGFLVATVILGSAAAKAGIQQGDVILVVNEWPITTPADFQSAIVDTAISGKTIPVIVWRDRNELKVMVSF